jgi:hypothetical protein
MHTCIGKLHLGTLHPLHRTSAGHDLALPSGTLPASRYHAL